ncbi:MAG: hypothetical protein Q4B40_07290 [Clostridia bacterium]|nr:hypothetical protein [Clostridia bacterium]
MAKDTIEIIKELNLCEDFKTFYNENKKDIVGCVFGKMELVQKVPKM